MKKLEPLTSSSELPQSTVLDGRLDIPAGAALSPALRRLVEEVRMERAAVSSSPTNYDRVHNRHNR